MSCVLNINRFIIPNDVIVSLTEIYKYIGENELLQRDVGNDINCIVEQTVERDAYFLSRILKLDMSDTRVRLIITKNSSPRNKEETTLSNIKDMLSLLQQDYKRYGIQSNDLLNMINSVFSHSTNIKYDFVASKKRAVLASDGARSKRLIIDEINDEMKKIITGNKYEKLILYLHFFIDFYNINPFTSQNLVASYILLYQLLLKADIEAFRYVSFFEMIYNEYDLFLEELKNVAFNWEEGYAQTLGFVRFMMKIIINGYKRTNEIMRDYKFDKNFKKHENIENTIMSMPEIFSKEEIRLLQPYVSESTINRALISLRDEGLIEPLGKGRSARWRRLGKKYSNG